MYDPEIDIPRVVATAADAPKDSEELCRIVQTELSAYWAKGLTLLPCRESPKWPPLP